MAVAVACAPSPCDSMWSTLDAQGPVKGPAKARFVPVSTHFLKSRVNGRIVNTRCSSRMSSAPLEMLVPSTT